MGLIQIALLAALIILAYRGLSGAGFGLRDIFSDSRTCPRCDGKGWWQNTRNRDRCEWCNGSGRVPKDFPL